MKKFLFLSFISLSIIACGDKEKSVEEIIEDGNLSEIRAKKSELTTQQNQLKEQIELLNDEIEKLDTNTVRTLVTVETLKDTLFKHYVEVQGDVETDQNIIIYPEFSGILTSIYVEEGQKVSKGQRLAKIDDGGLSSQLAQSESQLALAKTTYERQERLWNQNIGSEIQYLEAKTNYEAMQNSVNQLRTQLSKTVITAPFAGTIDQVIADEGQVVSPGQNQIFRLVNLNKMYVTAEVPETYLGKINKGTEVLIELSSIGKEFEGSVAQVSDFINPNNRSFQVKVNVPNEEGLVKPNLIATVKLNDYTSENAIVIPLNILQENAEGKSIAYTVKKESDTTGIAQRKIVKTGLNYNDKIEVLEGLEGGQTIIVEGARSTREGQEVKISTDVN
ncbi:efflux RND transporter periplasmic adaptor subunit [Mesonia sp.]|uniref:efflux RND transporter periplasmic adaptor subunit n=1 Tax=Mesonia sp. TaxID=1960830 RepID=UPI0017766DE4|nr:efflux RND transporter periplasmic adaptor subunit [Mesonia sp.]HIB38023.1 efflux RND transporter periplasmic adaptor subunit [Mesonia sp.]HIO27437.1 efflux RND transporter periplasmic adaptor subunit [Flavobacteriaceae bacterium]